MQSSDVPRPNGSGVAFVTGAGGFLGGAVAAALHGSGWTVAAVGHPRRFPASAASPALIEGDVDHERLSEALQAFGPPEIVFHAAGGASVGASLANPEADRRRTVGSLEQLLAFLRDEAPQARLVYPSSAAVYGASVLGPIPETSAPDPISPYGRHKLEAEGLILAAARDRGLDAAVIRFFSLYGPGLGKQLLWDLAQRLETSPEAVELSGTGDEARDFLFVDDAVRLVGRAASLPRQDLPLIVNGGTGTAVTVRVLAEALVGALGVKTRVGFSGTVREGDPISLVADAARAEELGFSPTVPLERGLQRYAAWIAAERGRSPA